MLDALLLLGPAGQPSATETAYHQLLPPLASRLGLAPHSCFLAFRERTALAAVDTLLAGGYRRLVVQPLALEAQDHAHEAILGGLDWVRVQTPQLSIHYGKILAAAPPLLTALADRVAASLAVTAQHGWAETAVLLVGRGGHNAENNAEIARIARLLWEGRAYGWVEAAYYQQTRPGMGEGLHRCCQLGARRIVVVPYRLFGGNEQSHFLTQIKAFQAEHPAVKVTLADALATHPGVIETISQQVMAAAAPSPRRSGHSHPHSHHAPQRPHPPAFLPPRYRQGAVVSATPMRAAALVYDAEGRVAWDQIWGTDDPSQPFCELALAGGPPHRGDLLEPATPELVKADWAGYGRVLAELTRGIQVTTGLRTRLSQAPGWIGVECHSEAMALWLLRAIVVENVSVRREGAILYLPAGPAFRLEHEIKNVITALAKTHHYWQEHLHG